MTTSSLSSTNSSNPMSFEYILNKPASETDQKYKMSFEYILNKPPSETDQHKNAFVNFEIDSFAPQDSKIKGKKSCIRRRNSSKIITLKTCNRKLYTNTIHYEFHKKIPKIQEMLKNDNNIKAIALECGFNRLTLSSLIKDHNTIYENGVVYNKYQKKITLKKCDSDHLSEFHQVFHDKIDFLQKSLDQNQDKCSILQQLKQETGLSYSVGYFEQMIYMHKIVPTD